MSTNHQSEEAAHFAPKYITMALVPVVEELDQAEDVGFYFKFLGGVTFANLPAAMPAPGSTAMVAASSKHGLVFFSDLSGGRDQRNTRNTMEPCPNRRARACPLDGSGLRA